MYHPLLLCQGFVAATPVTILIDSGATGNFISQSLVTSLRLPTDPSRAWSINGFNQTSSVVGHFVPRVSLSLADLADHLMSIDFISAPLSQYDIVLGLPWHASLNPDFDYSRNLMFINIGNTRYSVKCDSPSSTPVSTDTLLSAVSLSSVPRPPSPIVLEPPVTAAPPALNSEPIVPSSLLSPVPVVPLNQLSNLPRNLITQNQTSIYRSTTPEKYVKMSEIQQMSAKELERHLKKHPKSAQVYAIFTKYDPESKSMVLLNTETNELKPHNPVPEDPAAYIRENISDLRLQKILLKHVDCFKALENLPPKRSVDHKIDLTSNEAPPWRPLYQLTPEELKMLKDELDRLLKLGFIKSSTSPFGAPLFFVKQKDKLRLVFDYRALNKITVKNRTALPHMHQALQHFRDAKFFTKIDLQSGFHQIRIAEDDTHKTAFRTKYGHFEFTVLPFGLSNSPATFQRLMNDIFRDFVDEFVECYLDDVTIYSKTADEHYEHIEKVLKRCLEHKLFIRLPKCTFMKDEVTFVGYKIKNNVIEVDPSRAAAIKDWPLPQTITQLRSYLGLCNTLARNIAHLSEHLHPMHALISGENIGKNSKKPVPWTPETVKHFESTKEILCKPENLYVPDPDKTIHLFSDWSTQGKGGWIGQTDENNTMRPIAYESAQLTQGEKNYSPYNGEMSALAHNVKIFRPYIWGRDVICHTDHDSLKQLLDQKNLLPHQQRWIDLFTESNFKFEYFPGKYNTIADILSRKPRSRDIGLQATIHSMTNDDFLASVAQALPTDEFYLTQSKSRDEKFTISDNLLWYKSDRLYVPPPLRLAILQTHHDNPYAGHTGWKKLYSTLNRYYYWPNMEIDCQAYCRSCDACQRNKSLTQKPHGKLQPLPIPEHKFQWWTFDFITHLPESNGYDSITVFVERLLKYVVIIPSKSTDTSEDIANSLQKHIFTNFGTPQYLVTDRDPRFTSHHWKDFVSKYNIDHRLSTAYHPETDGQTERTNRTLEQFLRMYIDYDQANWSELLPYAQFALNNAPSATTRHTPFFLAYGCHPRTPGMKLDSNHQQTPTDMEISIQQAKKFIRIAQETQSRYYDQKHKPIEFSVGDKVLLRIGHLQIPSNVLRRSRKLQERFIGPFTILKCIGKNAYKLELPKHLSRLHPVFSVAYLRPYIDPRENFPERPIDERPPPELVDNYYEYEVESILDSRQITRFKQRLTLYLVKWKGFPLSEATWEPAEHLDSASETLKAYFASHPTSKRPNARS